MNTPPLHCHADPGSERIAFVHIGGPKTGSTTIQKALSTHPLPAHHYIQTGNSNHSRMLSLLFGRGNDQMAPYFRRRGWGSAQLETQRKDWLADLSHELETSDQDVIFSAEALCTPMFDEASLEAFRSFLAPHVHTIQVIGYVRSPVSYSQSSFQQRLKGLTPVSLDLSPVRYIKRFQKFDTVFGRENVTLCHYDRGSLARMDGVDGAGGGDVVVDIARKLGVDLVDYRLSESNTSLSLTAVALLYARRKFGREIKPYPEYDADTRALLRALGKLRGGKLVFSPALLAPMLKASARDIAWMEERLGVAINDAPEGPTRDRTGDAQVIASEDDLLAVAQAAEAQLQTVLIEELLHREGGGEREGERARAKGAQKAAHLTDLLRQAVSGR